MLSSLTNALLSFLSDGDPHFRLRPPVCRSHASQPGNLLAEFDGIIIAGADHQGKPNQCLIFEEEGTRQSFWISLDPASDSSAGRISTDLWPLSQNLPLPPTSPDESSTGLATMQAQLL